MLSEKLQICISCNTGSGDHDISDGVGEFWKNDKHNKK